MNNKLFVKLEIIHSRSSSNYITITDEEWQRILEAVPSIGKISNIRMTLFSHPRKSIIIYKGRTGAIGRKYRKTNLNLLFHDDMLMYIRAQLEKH